MLLHLFESPYKQNQHKFPPGSSVNALLVFKIMPGGGDENFPPEVGRLISVMLLFGR
jgi:hypothetical protein